MEDKAMTTGNAASDVQNKPTKEDSERKDEYGNNTYKDRAQGLSEAQRFGTDQMPVQHDALPAKNLKNYGG